MKNSVLTSFIVHFLLIIIAIFWRSEPKRWTKATSIYPVELVSMIQIKESPVIQKEEMKTVQQSEKPKEEAINISKKAVKKQAEQKREVPKESAPTPKVPAASESGGLKINTGDFPFSYYLTILQNRIQNNWQPPYQTSAQQEKMLTVIAFQVLRNGKIANVALEKSSGRFLYDQAAQRAVYSANPLPPLPDEFRGEFLSVHIEFEGMW